MINAGNLEAKGKPIMLTSEAGTVSKILLSTAMSRVPCLFPITEDIHLCPPGKVEESKPLRGRRLGKYSKSHIYRKRTLTSKPKCREWKEWNEKHCLTYLPDVVKASSTGDHPVSDPSNEAIQSSQGSASPVITSGLIQILQSS